MAEDEVSPCVTPLTVAEWMLARLGDDDTLVQQAAAYDIHALFGEVFVRRDANGDLGIARSVLAQFRKLSGDSIVWVAVQGDWLAGYWRKREVRDGEGRRQWHW